MKTQHLKLRNILISFAGLAYGGVLLAIGILLGEAGHGSYIALALCGAPLCLLGIVTGMGVAPAIVSPVFWMSTALLSVLKSSSARIWLGSLLLIHYVCLGYAVLANVFDDRSALERQWHSAFPKVLLIAAGLAFLIAQLWLWTRVFAPRRDLERDLYLASSGSSESTHGR